MDDRLEQTQLLYERAVFGGDASALAEAERHLTAVEADLVLARGRVMHGRFLDATSQTLEAPADIANELALFERAMELYRRLGDVRGGKPRHSSGSARFIRLSDTTMRPRFLRSSEPVCSRPKQPIR